jgi:uncharacterized C2H2 Zn-finger protein
MKEGITPMAVKKSFKNTGMWPFDEALIRTRASQNLSQIEAVDESSASEAAIISCSNYIKQTFQLGSPLAKTKSGKIAEKNKMFTGEEAYEYFHAEEERKKAEADEKAKRAEELAKKKRKREEDKVVKEAAKKAKVAEREKLRAMGRCGECEAVFRKQKTWWRVGGVICAWGWGCTAPKTAFTRSNPSF